MLSTLITIIRTCCRRRRRHRSRHRRRSDLSCAHTHHSPGRESRAQALANAGGLRRLRVKYRCRVSWPRSICGERRECSAECAGATGRHRSPAPSHVRQTTAQTHARTHVCLPGAAAGCGLGHSALWPVDVLAGLYLFTNSSSSRTRPTRPVSLGYQSFDCPESAFLRLNKGR